MSCGEKSRPTETVNYNSSESKLLQEINKFPDSALLKENLMQYYRETGNYDNAIALVDEVITKDSINIHYLDIKGILTLEKGDTMLAIEVYEKAIEINPQPEYVISLSVLYAQTKNPMALAMADALLLSENANKQREATFIKGLYYTYSGDKQRAIRFFDECISMSYTHMDAYLEKAIAQADLGKTEEAIATLDKAVKLDNGFEEGHYFKGKFLEKMKRMNEAIESYQTALLYDPNYNEPREALSRLGIKN